VICSRVRRSAGEAAYACLLLLGLLLSAAFPFEACAGQQIPKPKKSHEKPYALIFGTVWGPDNHPVYGVRVRVRRAREKKIRWELYSDHNGEFAFRLPAGRGDYVVSSDLKASKLLPGKQLQAAQEAQVHIENDERSDIGLHLK
jgi:hypothetical protein